MEWIGLKPNPGKRLGIRAVLAFTSLPELHKEAATTTLHISLLRKPL